MAGSKASLFLFALVFALVCLISSEVSASVHETEKSTEGKGVQESKSYGGPGNGYQGGYGGGHQGGYGGGHQGGYGGGHGHGHGGCQYGCCHGCCRSYRYGSGCQRCCVDANEAPDAEFEDDVKN
ncbi:hypothetical protein VitviT2T_017755 [Vitis vinifera]|uniref:Glycine-rich protein n=2 Tax=Vitis vinifera TaxID=29760 RepID=D7TE59_VITVI|eukprot:XP_002265274.1 PREDICTED: keratin-associated protein 6-2 [Vitis vinifera]